MEETKRYTIAYRGLRSGLHDFHFKVDGGLFRAFGSTEIKDGDCDVSVALERGESMLTLDVNVDGSVVVECDRCLEDCNVPIHYEGQLLVKFSDEVHEYDGEVIWLFLLWKPTSIIPRWRCATCTNSSLRSHPPQIRRRNHGRSLCKPHPPGAENHRAGA